MNSPARPASRRTTIVAASPLMREFVDALAKIAELDGTSVLLYGAPGTGKSIAAAAIHQASSFSAGRVVGFDCASWGEHLGELWPVTGERSTIREPRTRKAAPQGVAGTTLVLREIARLPRAAQASLLEWLNTGNDRVTAQDGPSRDVRIVATTSFDLPHLVRIGAFRGDLYSRLAALQLRVPGLSERPADIMPLANYFLTGMAGTLGRELRFAPDTSPRLVAYNFPGNVAELRAIVETAALAARGPIVELPSALGCSSAAQHGSPFFVVFLGEGAKPPTLAVIDHRYAVRVLQHADGNRSQTARLLGVSYPTVAKKLNDW